MSEVKRISPLLDGFSVGNPISEHNGIRCCPAVKENTDKKYIVKIISIPASQVQMDALLLAGAYKDPADAMDYFKQIGEDIMQEAEFLKTLSRLDGFLPYENWQMEPITKKRLGYEVYLISSYKRSLEKHVKRNPVTHLEAINLGLDLCSALSVCRDAGALYVDLKPSNVFVSDKKEYRICDLGFIRLDALSYTSLPEKYCSVYTPPELFDPMASLNMTVDTYAVGMILYQLYNDGQLPFKEKAPEQPLPSPLNADYEIAEIIMKAIHPDPAQRWDDPRELGKALAGYMQKNVVNDVPITPYVPLDVAPEDVMLVKKEQPKPEAVPAIEDEQIQDLVMQENPADSSDVSDDPTVNEVVSVETVETEITAEHIEEATSEEVPASEEIPSVTDDPEPEVQEDELLPDEMSNELSKMMAKANDLIEHTVPEGVVVPEVPESPDPFAFATEDSDEVDDSGIPLDPVMEEPEDVKPKKKKKRGGRFDSPERKKKWKRLTSSFLWLMVIAAIAAAGLLYYQFFYLQSIEDLVIQGDKHALTVTVKTQIDTEPLTVSCSDNYGNVKTGSLTNGQVSFTELLPNTMYTIRLEIDGFHKLTGETTGYFTTDATTNIVSFTAVTGTENGSVLLNFTADGEEPDVWNIDYAAEGEEPKRETFTGHSVSISDLTVGKVYTFTLDAGGNMSISGNTELQFMASRLILAEDLTVTSAGSEEMTVHWKAPGDIVVESWDVRCYSDSGYEQQMNVTNTEVYLTDIDPTVSYTIEVTAAGMTQPARTSITANPIRIEQVHVDDSKDNELTVNWDYVGAAPEGGWLLMYSMDGGNTKNVLKCKDASAVIPNRIPEAKYQISFEAADGTSVFNSSYTYLCPEAERFSAHGLSAENVEIQFAKAPAQDGWHYGQLESDAFTDTFHTDDTVALILHAGTDFYLPGYEVEITYVIWDSYGNLLPELTVQEQTYWKDLWYTGDYHYAELELPEVPKAPGSYTVHLLFNGLSVGKAEFTIAE